MSGERRQVLPLARPRFIHIQRRQDALEALQAPQARSECRRHSVRFKQTSLSRLPCHVNGLPRIRPDQRFFADWRWRLNPPFVGKDAAPLRAHRPTSSRRGTTAPQNQPLASVFDRRCDSEMVVLVTKLRSSDSISLKHSGTRESADQRR